MDIQSYVESLVILADRNFLGLPNNPGSEIIPKSPLKLLESTLQKYAPMFQLRCSDRAWDYAYYSYTQKHTELFQNTQPVSFDVFQYRCVTNFENHNLYVQALEYVSTLLPETVSLAYVGLDGSGAGTLKSIG